MAIVHKPAGAPDPTGDFDHPVLHENEREEKHPPGFSDAAVKAARGHTLPPLSEVEIPKTSLAERIRARRASG